MSLFILLSSVELRMVIRRPSVLGRRWVRTPTCFVYVVRLVPRHTSCIGLTTQYDGAIELSYHVAHITLRGDEALRHYFEYYRIGKIPKIEDLLIQNNVLGTYIY
jgi:hypothetical protein